MALQTCQEVQRLVQLLRETGCSDALWSDVPMPTQKTGQRLVTALLSWWPIYMCSPGHLMFAGVPRHLIHIQEHLQAIQELSDRIL